MDEAPNSAKTGLICPRCGANYSAETEHKCAAAIATAPLPGGKPSASPVLDGSIHPGQIIDDRYEVITQLSLGGMGAVYKARHLGLGSLVALKIVRGDGDKQFQQRFIQEARLASKIKHPNVVYLSDFGPLPSGRSYLVMEYLEGNTLTQLLKQGPLDVLRACMLALQIVRGVAAAHEQGIVHRDLKPDNIFVVANGTAGELVKIIDFGIAKRAQQNPTEALPRLELAGSSEAPQAVTAAATALTQAGALIGTPGYMAPEQCRGGAVDHRADQYSIGCILYRMLAGAPVFAGTTAADLFAQHLIEEVLPLRTRWPELQIPTALDALVVKLLAKRPDGRFASLKEVDAALIEVIEESEQSVRSSTGKLLSLPPGQRSLGRHDSSDRRPLPVVPANRRRAVLIGLAMLGVVLAAVVLVAQRFWRRDAQRLTLAEVVKLRERALSVLAEDVRSSDSQLRISALEALGKSHEGLALPILKAVYQLRGSEREHWWR